MVIGQHVKYLWTYSLLLWRIISLLKCCLMILIHFCCVMVNMSSICVYIRCWYDLWRVISLLISSCCCVNDLISSLLYVLLFKYRLATGSSRRGFMSEWSMCSLQGALRSLGWGSWRMTTLRLRRRQRVRSSAPRGNRRVPNQVSWLLVLN